MLLARFMDYFFSTEYTWHVMMVLLYIFMVFVVNILLWCRTYSIEIVVAL